MEEIARHRPAGRASPPNFNDQCAAFISCDIKNAFQEGMSMEDIVAGLVYSICMNYSNRVKGNRHGGQQGLHAGRRLLQPGRAAGHGGAHRQADHRPARSGAHGRLRRGPGDPAQTPRPAETGEFLPQGSDGTGKSSTARLSSATAARKNATGAARLRGSGSTARPIPSAGPATAGTICGWPSRADAEASTSFTGGSDSPSTRRTGRWTGPPVSSA